MKKFAEKHSNSLPHQDNFHSIPFQSVLTVSKNLKKPYYQMELFTNCILHGPVMRSIKSSTLGQLRQEERRDFKFWKKMHWTILKTCFNDLYSFNKIVFMLLWVDRYMCMENIVLSYIFKEIHCVRN